MASAEKLRQRLQAKLKELFQLDQPDLDFGFYRIMHARAAEVETFIEQDLLKIISQALGQFNASTQEKLQQAYEEAILTAQKFGAPDPEATEPVKEAKAALDALKDNANAEADIYNHLYRFFERYYDNGDFISRRYYARETPGKAAPFAIPYNGEEVKLHWANADQYYIKTTEYFSQFTFDLHQAKEVSSQLELETVTTATLPLKVHFQVVVATEGEHGNVKASEATRRFFIIHEKEPVLLNPAGELVVQFEYRPDPEKTGTEGTWREKRNKEAVATVLAAVEQLSLGDEVHQNIYANYLRCLKIAAPTESEKNRSLLAKYINQYTARNTMDYFIHKDLGGFLRRELDFYIKNEVMHLDDIEHANAPTVESYLSKIKVLRQIAGKLIDFLAQLENFQKKLWLKKKFVIETNYGITLDRVPEALYLEIAVNQAQIAEWIKLYAIDEIKETPGDLLTPGTVGYSEPLTVEFLQQNDKLVLDTAFFSENFKERLLATIENFDEQCDGVLIHSENFQALSLLQSRYRENVNYIHIDPPYNTATSGFLYKNEYQHSSWLTLMQDRILYSSCLLSQDGIYQCHIDENEYESLFLLFEFLGLPNIGTIVWDKKNPMLGRKGVATQHEYIICRSSISSPLYMGNESILKILNMAMTFINQCGGVNNQSRSLFSKWISKQSNLSGGERAYKFIEDDGRVYRGVAMGAPEQRTDSKFYIPLIHPITNRECPVPENGWSRTPETIQDLIKNNEIMWGKDHTVQPQKKVFLNYDSRRQISSVIEEAKSGKKYLDDLSLFFPYCHPVSLYVDLVGLDDNKNSSSRSYLLDYFAGSGTTGHAVINLNREDGGQRKYILVEMADYFDTVLKPRIAKVVYADSWKEGKPTNRDSGISHCFKYLRLESYEDTLNNLRLNDHPRQSSLLNNPDLKTDYLLHYFLDVETRGSQSLLNIDAFADPTAYTLNVKRPGTDAYVTRTVDLIETFNYLLGLRLLHVDAPQTFTAEFQRLPDPEVPNQTTKLVLNGKLQQSKTGLWWFRKVEGWIPKDTANPNNGQKENVLIVWRKLTGDLEQDNLMLDEWFQKQRINPRDFEFDTIYVNGSNNLPNLKRDDEHWKVQLIEEAFHQKMWDISDI